MNNITISIATDRRLLINRISRLCKRVPIHSRTRVKSMLEQGAKMLIAYIDNTPVGHIIAKKDERDHNLFMIDLLYDTEEIKHELIKTAKVMFKVKTQE